MLKSQEEEEVDGALSRPSLTQDCNSSCWTIAWKMDLSTMLKVRMRLEVGGALSRLLSLTRDVSLFAAAHDNSVLWTVTTR